MIMMAEFQIGEVENVIRGDDCTMSTMLQTPVSKSSFILFILFEYFFFYIFILIFFFK